VDKKKHDVALAVAWNDEDENEEDCVSLLPPSSLLWEDDAPLPPFFLPF